MGEIPLKAGPLESGSTVNISIHCTKIAILDDLGILRIKM